MSKREKYHESANADRIEWIDIARGIGIILVIMGHTISLSYSKILYSFHLPLFFFLSGFVFKEPKSFGYLVHYSSTRILKPWFLYAFIGLIVTLCIPSWRSQLNWLNIAQDLYTANTNVIQNSSIWYLICYFWVPLIFYPIWLNMGQDPTKTQRNIVIIITILVLYLDCLMDLLPLPMHRLPFKIDSALVACVFFGAGHYFKKKINLFLVKTNVKRHVYYLVICFIVWLLFAVVNGWTNLNSFEFGRVRVFFYFTAFLGISFTILASYILQLTGREIKRIFLFYGENSLIIFGTQSIFIRLYLCFFNTFEDEQMILYADNPAIHQIGSFLFVTFIASPVIVYIFKFIRKLAR